MKYTNTCQHKHRVRIEIQKDNGHTFGGIIKLKNIKYTFLRKLTKMILKKQKGKKVPGRMQTDIEDYILDLTDFIASRNKVLLDVFPIGWYMVFN